MKLLAWDTSSKTGALAALEWEAGVSPPRLAAEWTLNIDSTHSERLLWGIHELLESARWKLADVDHFGVGVGPGSFTGLRIGVTTARTLAHTMKKPLVAVSSLAALARPAALWATGLDRRCVVVAATDAAKGELFSLVGQARAVADCVVLADGDFAGLWKRGVEETVLEPEALMKVIKKKLGESPKTSWIALGEGRTRYPDAWKILPKSKEIESPVPFSHHVQGRYVGLLAWEAIQAGLAREALLVHPRYVREADATRKLNAGLLQPGPTRG